MSQALQQDIEYVDVRTRPDHHEPTSFYEKWVDQSSAKHSTPELIAAETLRKLYPGHSLVLSEDYRLGSLLTLPGLEVHHPGSKEVELQQLSSVVFRQTPRYIGGKASGSLADNVIVGSLKLTWNRNDFVVYITKFQIGNFVKTVHFFLHNGPEQPARDLVLAICLYTEQTHNEIWVFNQGFWSKDKGLWLEIKDSSWDNVVMKEESKQALQKDIYGFFKSEATYKKLSIPWKRGLIMYGPPGNGKTISIKAIMNTCTDRGFTPLYVKSFQAPQGEEVSMQTVFSQARQVAPCVLILEDLDSLINDRNRSFFLNQLDGLEGNDGLLVIASTNHFDKLDPGLSNRPSRFDRRYLFDDPDYQTRVLYARYWQKNLKDNDEISFPDSLAQEVADLTQGFSFAYMKEAFVSALVRLTNADADERKPFAVLLKDQIANLRKELGKQTLPATEHTSCEDDYVQGSRQLPLPTLVEADTISDQAMARVAGMYGPAVACETSGFQQAPVLHAPLSAYPRVMPGSLPAASPDPLQASWSRAQGGANSGTGDVGASQSSDVDNTPLWRCKERGQR